MQNRRIVLLALIIGIFFGVAGYCVHHLRVSMRRRSPCAFWVTLLTCAGRDRLSYMGDRSRIAVLSLDRRRLQQEARILNRETMCPLCYQREPRRTSRRGFNKAPSNSYGDQRALDILRTGYLRH